MSATFSGDAFGVDAADMRLMRAGADASTRGLFTSGGSACCRAGSRPDTCAWAFRS